MRRIVIAVVAVLAILFVVRGIPRMGLFVMPGTFGGLLPLIAAGTIAVMLDRWASGRRRRRTPETFQHDNPAHANDDLEELARDLERTARNLEKRIDALETILLERSRPQP